VTRFILSLVALAISPTFLPATATAQSQPPAAAVTDALTLQPGDMLEIRVWRKPELSGEFHVAASGAISDPFYADVIVAGLPLNVARDRIRQHIARIEADPMVWVEPMLRIVVTGEVRQPGLYPVRYPTTIAQAIAQAGGTTDLAKVERIQLVRAGAAQRIDLRHPTAQNARIVLQSGDEIVVPRRSTAFRDALIPLSTLASLAGLIVTLSTR
jgi:polysaccharide biosynthesis/export protein